MPDLDDEKAGPQIVPDTPDDEPPSPTAKQDDPGGREDKAASPDE